KRDCAGGSSSKRGPADVSNRRPSPRIRRDQRVLAEVALPGSVPHRFGAAARPFVCVPGSRWGREPAHPDGPSPRGDGPSRTAFLFLDRPARTGALAPSLRDVSRGSGAGKTGEGPRNTGRALADLLVPARRIVEPGARLGT